jgi:chromosome segregation protein
MQKDYGGYSKSVKNILNESTKIIKSFCGAIGELITVPSQFVTAIEIALGASVQSIVTETENDAKLLIEHLKKHNLGRATFLPISSVKPRYFNDKDKRHFAIDGFVGVASELIQFDCKIYSIISSLLGRTAIVRDMDAAIKLARLAGYEYKIVTLTGEVLNAGGSITGGSVNQAASSVLSRKNEIENLKVQIEKLKSEYDELNLKLTGSKNQLLNYDTSINQNISDSHNLQIELNNCKNKHDNLVSEIQLISDRISLNNKEIEELSHEGEESNKSIDEFKEKSESMENERIALETQISELQLQAKQLKETKDAYNNEITDMKVKMAAIEQNKSSLEQSIIELEDKLLKLQNDISSNEAQVENLALQAVQYTTELELKKKEIVLIRSQIEKLSRLYDLKGEERDKLHAETQEIQENIKVYNKDTTELQNNLHKIEMQHAKLEVELENVEMKLLETYDINYSKALNYRDENISLSWASKRCEELKSEIRAMGSVNVNAVEDYEKISQRYEFLNTQVDDLTKGRDSLIQVIVEISETMKIQFLTEFYKINENFTEVFAQLFGGGHAQLILSDESNVLESGIEIIAKPPGKKLQNLMLLSGGERALTATALLFAILKMKPAPFCVLDEIDAALDDANVDRYAKFLKEFSKTTQFIIVTHRKGTMQVADCLYGVSMEESGVSKLISVKLEDKVS